MDPGFASRGAAPSRDFERTLPNPASEGSHDYDRDRGAVRWEIAFTEKKTEEAHRVFIVIDCVGRASVGTVVIEILNREIVE